MAMDLMLELDKVFYNIPKYIPDKQIKRYIKLKKKKYGNCKEDNIIRVNAVLRKSGKD